MTTPPATTGTPRRAPEKQAADGTWQAVRDMRRVPTERSTGGASAPRDGSGASAPWDGSGASAPWDGSGASAPRTTNPAPSVSGEQASDGTRQALPDMSRIPAEREAPA